LEQVLKAKASLKENRGEKSQGSRVNDHTHGRGCGHGQGRGGRRVRDNCDNNEISYQPTRVYER